MIQESFIDSFLYPICAHYLEFFFIFSGGISFTILDD